MLKSFFDDGDVVVERSSLAERVCSSLITYIKDSELQAGEKLPSELKLAKLFGVSRLAMRESLVRLKAFGIIEARHGLGWFLKKFEAADCFSQLSPMLKYFVGADLDQIMETRLIIEPMLAYKAAGGEISEEGVALLKECVTGMEDTVSDRKLFIKYDMAFHSTLATECGNEILTAICAMLRDLLRKAQWAYRNTEEDRDKSMIDHLAIFQAIESGDPEEAKRAMRQHIQRVWGKLDSAEEI